MDPTLQTALLGAGVGGLGGLALGRNRLRDALLFAALGAGLGGGGQYLAQRGGRLSGDEKKKPPPSPPPTEPGAAAADTPDVRRRLLGYGAGAAGGMALQRRLGKPKYQGLERGAGRGVFEAKKPRRGWRKGAIGGLAATALLDYLTSR